MRPANLTTDPKPVISLPVGQAGYFLLTFKNIKSMATRKGWSDNEDNILADTIEKNGFDIGIDMAHEQLTDRTLAACKSRAYSKGLVENTRTYTPRAKKAVMPTVTVHNNGEPIEATVLVNDKKLIVAQAGKMVITVNR